MISAVSDLFLSLLLNIANVYSGNFGLSIITLTLIIRLILYPIIVPSLKSQKKISALKPELDKIKKKYAGDKTKLNQKQLELYQKNQINPAAGCLPQLVQIGMFIIFYRVLINSLNGSTPDNIDLNFLWLKLNEPDGSFILPVVAGVTQFVLGLMISPGASTAAEKTLAAQTKTKKDDKEADNMSDMAQTMQSQMLFVMPFITVVFASRFPSGLALYWVTSTLFSIIQQYTVSGPGGLVSYLNKARNLINKQSSL